MAIRVGILALLVSVSLSAGWRPSASEQSPKPQTVAYPPDKPDPL
jgi:hypothetical protein